MSATRRPIQRLAYRREEAAAALGMSVDHFDRHVRPELAVVYSGNLKLYATTQLERWLEQHTALAPLSRERST